MKIDDYIQDDISRIVSYTGEILNDVSMGKSYTSTIKTCEQLLWCLKDLESRTRYQD